MSRVFSIRATVLSVILVGIALTVWAGTATAADIVLSGHINYEGPGGVFYSPEGANVTAKYMDQLYFMRADSHGDYSITIPLSSSYIIAFKINYTDPDGNYHVWPREGWHETLLPGDYRVVQDMILIKSDTPAPTPEPTATPVPTPTSTPVPSATPSPTPEPTVSPSPTPVITTPTPVPATPVPTKTPSSFLSAAGSLAVLGMIGYLARRKL